MHLFGLCTSDSIQIVVQVISVVCTFLAVIASLCIAWRDRVNARNIAAKDRQLSQLQYRLGLLGQLYEEMHKDKYKTLDTSAMGDLRNSASINILGAATLPRTWAMLHGEHPCSTQGIINANAETSIIRKEVDTAIKETSKRIGELTSKV